MRPHSFIEDRTKIGLIAGAFGVFLLISYALYVALPYLLGPSLTLDAQVSGNGSAVISGTTNKVSYLTLNGMEVPLEENGNFSTTRVYPSGYTVIQAQARDRFGRTITKTLNFTVTATTTYGEKESRQSTSTGTIVR